MKIRTFAALTLFFGFTVASAQDVTTVAPSNGTSRPLAAGRADPDLVREMCLRAIRNEETASKEIWVERVSPLAPKADAVVTCEVKAKIAEGHGPLWNHGTVTLTDALYSVTVNLATRQANIERIDEEAARQAALAGLSAMFIELKPKTISPDDAIYTAEVGGNTCVVRVSTATSDEPKRWLLKKIDCGPERRRQ